MLSPCQWEDMKWPLFFRLKGTVILRIWWQILIMAAYTCVIVFLHTYIVTMNFPVTLVPVLGLVTGLLLVFRTNTAYDRYWAGRRIWSQLTYHTRDLTLAIWVGVDHSAVNQNMAESRESKEGEDLKLIEEKKSAIKLLVAFAYATKNYLRQEFAYDAIDMKDLVSHLPQFQAKFKGSRGHTQDHQNCGKFERVDSSESSTSGQSTSQLTNDDLKTKRDSWKSRKNSKFGVKNLISNPPTNIPVELSFYLFSYVRKLGEIGKVDLSLMKVMYEGLFGLVECLTGFERILGTPIPLAYGVHLHQAVWLYLLALPYQIVEHLSFFTIPAVSLAAFALLGILGIGYEIENPFGYDDNDLPLDDFCQDIRREVEIIIERPLASLDTWINSNENYPLAPNSWLNANQLLDKSEKELNDILLQKNESPAPRMSTDKIKRCVYISRI